MSEPSARPHVVIVGGGFGGIYAARALARVPVRITLLDRRNHHLFQPLLYQVATAALSAPNIAQPIRTILHRQKNCEVLMAEVKRVDVASMKVVMADSELSYDYLILATGATHSYFGHDEWADLAPGLKTLEDAVRIRSIFLTAFEHAERTSDDRRRKALLNFVIIGAGPTGVELAGTMAELARMTLSRDFRKIDPASARVLLLEGLPRVLPAYRESLSQSAQRQLEGLGVEVRTGSIVTRIEKGAVWIGDEKIETESVFWAAGVAASPLGKTLGVPTDRAGRVEVHADLSISKHPEVFVIGDLAACTDIDGNKVPGVAPAAMQMAQHATDCIKADLHHVARQSFRYWDKGSLATIGRAAAVADLGKAQMSGFLAWLAWLFIHVYFLIGFENRLLVLTQWALNYLTFARGARIITHYEDPDNTVPCESVPLSR